MYLHSKLDLKAEYQISFGLGVVNGLLTRDIFASVWCGEMAQIVKCTPLIRILERPQPKYLEM